jgi:de-etiolated-1
VKNLILNTIFFYREAVINQLKHRILVYLYKRAVKLSQVDGNPFEIRKFYQFFDQLRALRMWKMQLLDENHLLIKYASEEVVTLRSSEPNSQASFFVIYNFADTEVKAVYENTSEDLLQMFENFCDFFRNTNIHNDRSKSYHGFVRPTKNHQTQQSLVAQHQVTSSPSNNVFAALIQQRFKQTIGEFQNKLFSTTQSTRKIVFSAVARALLFTFTVTERARFCLHLQFLL